MAKHPQQDSIEEIFNIAVTRELTARNLISQDQNEETHKTISNKNKSQNPEKENRNFAKHVLQDVFKPLQKTFKTMFSRCAEAHISIFEDRLYLDILTEPEKLVKATKSDDRGSFKRLNSGIISPLYALEAYPKDGKLFVEYRGIDVDPQYRGVPLSCTEESLIARTSHALHYLSDKTLKKSQRSKPKQRQSNLRKL